MQVLSEDMIVCATEFVSRRQVYRFVTDRLCATGRASGPDALVAAFLARDAAFSTYMEGGIAIPHCKSPFVRQATALVICNRAPVPWCGEGEEADLIFPLAVPDSGAPKAHLRTLARLAQSLMDAQTVAEIRNSRSPAGVLAALKTLNEEDAT